MKPEISEFSYGYAVTEGIVRSQGPLKAAPSFPTLRSEGTTGGYDVKLDIPGFPLFLQFKLTDYMVRSTAYETKRRLFTTPFFRMHIRPQKRFRQHELLFDLEETGKAVYYVAPAFFEERDFNLAYISRSILTKSVMISPTAIGRLGKDENHHISFKNANQGFGYLLSRAPHKVEILSWDDVKGRMDQQWNRAERSLQELLPKMETQMLDIIYTHFEGELHSDLEQVFRDEVQHPTVGRTQELSLNELIWEFMADKDKDPLSRVASLSQVFFNCGLFIVQHST